MEIRNRSLVGNDEETGRILQEAFPGLNVMMEIDVHAQRSLYPAGLDHQAVEEMYGPLAFDAAMRAIESANRYGK